MALPSHLPWPWGSQRARIAFAISNALEVSLPECESLPGVMPRGPLPQTLLVQSLDMHITENKQAHNTSMYKNSSLIVRRNKEFLIDILFDRPFDETQDTVQLEFMIGSVPDENKGTYITVSFGRVKTESSWRGRLLEKQGNSIRVGITPDVQSIIGRFSTFAVVVNETGKRRTEKNSATDFYVLFNPWDPSDQVYMPNEAERQEYVMNDVGTIYNGEINDISFRSWNYGQFEEGVLDACLYILDSGKMPLMYRGNATEVARQASALMNSIDDNGVLAGDWSGDYSSGTAPTAWTGSGEILLKYSSKGGAPVCFAQCWVFAGTLNTFFRALGMPARVITNYCSAHDNGGNIKANIMLNPDGSVNRKKTRDSIWNYHCWNEVFMKRFDLPDQYSGWQVADCTPQETSDGLYRCGPTSVRSIKEGDLSYSFDSRFVFAEVSSGVVFHQFDKYGNSKIVHVDNTYVGQLIVTKSPNTNGYDDITLNYKYPKGSVEDKRVMQLAERRGIPKRKYSPLPDAGVQIDIKAETIKIGDNFTLAMNIKNQTSQTSTVSLTVTGCAMYYTGLTSSTFKLENYSSTVDAWQTTSVTMNVQAAEYMSFLVEQSNLLFVVHGQVNETGKSVSAMRVINLRPPELMMKVTGVPQVGRDLMVSVSFQNTYNFTLKNVQLRLDGAGLTPTKVKSYDQVAPGGSVQYKDTITPYSPGRKVLIGCLDCIPLSQITNQLEINVVN
nr:Zgc:152982 [Danio rerio]